MKTSIRTAALVAAAALSVGAFVAPTASAAAPSTPQALVYVDATTTNGTVNRDVLGDDMVWHHDAQGMFDESTDQLYPSVVDELTNVLKPTQLRYPGGTHSEFFHWQRAVGPQAQRTPNALAGSQGEPTAFGPDEYGHLLDLTGADGMFIANFGSGTAAEAAGFVAYMTGAPGSSTWADMRVANGHRAPYDIRYVEVGNEEYLKGAMYWRTGTPVSVGGPAGACQSALTCLYIYGGTTSFTNQATVGYGDDSPQASISTGTKNQSLYAQYPPVAARSDTVFVSGTAWTRVSSLATAGTDDHVYTISDATGRITFGDGTHGAIPPSGASVTLSYDSGPHDGFLKFYQEIKAANPKVQVCSTDTTNDFLAAMGTKLPYDCLEDHEYTRSQQVADTVPMPQYRDEMIATADDQANAIAARQQAVRYFSGRDVPLYETEYGQLISAVPDDDPTYLESLNAALANASELANLIRLGVPVADREILDGAVADDGVHPLKLTTAITPGPDSFVTASGDIFKLFDPLAGGTQLDVQQPRNPALPDSFSQKTGSLNTVAVRHGDEIDVLAINRNNTDDLTTQVNLNGAAAIGPADYTRLDGPDATSFNTADNPNTVGFTSGHVSTSGSGVSVDLPAHSVTLLKIPVRSTHASNLTMDLSAPAQIAPGGTATVRASVHNGGAGRVPATVTPELPQGWGVSPASASVTVPAHRTTTLTFRVFVPAATPELRYQPSAVLSDAKGFIDKAVTTPTFVHTPTSLTDVVSDTYDNQRVGSSPAGYVVTGPAGSATVQPSPDEPGRVLQIHQEANAAQVSVDRPLPPTGGPTQVRLRVYAKQDLAAFTMQLRGSGGKPIVQMDFSADTNNDASILWSDGAALMGPLTGNRALPYCNPRCFYQPGRWYTFEFDLDPASGTYKVYFDGELAEQEAVDTTAGAPASISLQLPTGAAAGTFDIDDVAFATGPLARGSGAGRTGRG